MCRAALVQLCKEEEVRRSRVSTEALATMWAAIESDRGPPSPGKTQCAARDAAGSAMISCDTSRRGV